MHNTAASDKFLVGQLAQHHQIKLRQDSISRQSSSLALLIVNHYKSRFPKIGGLSGGSFQKVVVVNCKNSGAVKRTSRSQRHCQQRRLNPEGD
jgi:hypothetical protein